MNSALGQTLLSKFLFFFYTRTYGCLAREDFGVDHMENRVALRQLLLDPTRKLGIHLVRGPRGQQEEGAPGPELGDDIIVGEEVLVEADNNICFGDGLLRRDNRLRQQDQVRDSHAAIPVQCAEFSQ
jgi:hypothetical protein